MAYQVICHFLVFQLMILANQTCWLRSEFQLTDPLTFQLERRACSEWTEMWEQWGGLVINFLNFQFIYPCVSCMLLSSCLYSVILIVVCVWCCVFVWRPHVLLSDLVSAVSPRCLTLPHSPLCVFIVSVSLFLITFTPSLVVLLLDLAVSFLSFMDLYSSWIKVVFIFCQVLPLKFTFRSFSTPHVTVRGQRLWQWV